MKAALHVQHREAGLRRVAALVLAVHVGARPGLLVVLAGDDAIAERQGVLAGEVLQLAGALAADVVIVRGLAADDAAEGDVAVEAVAPREEVHRAHRHADRRRALEGARPGDPLDRKSTSLNSSHSCATRMPS